MAPSVQNGILASVSPTQIKQYEACPMQWYLQRVVGLSMPQSPAQGLGESIHTQLEKYMLHAEQPDHPSVLAAIQAGYVPAPQTPSSVVEEPRNYGLGIVAAGVPVRGRIDLLITPVDGLVDIVDWKSTSSWRYLKTPEELARDPQGTIYLHYAFSRHSDATSGRFSHVYLRTKGGSGARRVQTDPLGRDEVAQTYAHLETVVAEMKDCARIEVASDVPYKLTACDAYGGCAFRAQCSAQSRGIVQLLQETSVNPSHLLENAMSLSDRIKARRAATTTQSPAPVEAEQPMTMTPAPIPTTVTPTPAPVLAQGVVPPDAPVVARTVSTSTAAPVAAVTTSTPAPAPSAEALLTLYVDCIPEKGEASFVLLEDDIASRTPSLLAHLKATRGKEVPEGAVDLGEVAYGAGYGALVASYVLRPLSGVVVASSHGAASARVLEVLVPRAGKVVRARR